MFEYKDEYRLLSGGCLNLTDACNLRCIYCFVNQRPHYMTLDVAKDAVTYFVENMREKKRRGLVNKDKVSFINYFGGEPTLLWDEIIVPLTHWTEETYPGEVKFGMTTNGTLLNEERIDWLAEHGIAPLLSIDGAEETQNINRPCHDPNKKCFDEVMKNVPYLLKKFPNTTFRSTIAPETVEHTFKNYCFANSLGFKNIFMMPNGRTKWSAEKQQILKEEFDKIYAFRIQCFRMGLPVINFGPINDSFEHVMKHDKAIMRGETTLKSVSRSPMRCGLGTTSGSVGYDGTIYACQEQDSKGPEDIFYIGNIYQGGIDSAKHTVLLEHYTAERPASCENEALCSVCPMKNICESKACPSSSYDLFQDTAKDNEIHCLWLQMMFNNAANTMKILVNEKNEYFKNYLNKRCNYQKYFPNPKNKGVK